MIKIAINAPTHYFLMFADNSETIGTTHLNFYLYICHQNVQKNEHHNNLQ